MPIVYKVVRDPQDPELPYRSVMMGDHSPYCTPYAIGQTTTPPIGRLFVYKQLGFAVKFRNGNQSPDRPCLAILECEATSVQPIVSVARYLEPSHIRVFWDGLCTLPTAQAPWGSYTAATVTPLRVVDEQGG
ncbi:MAG TPA: hypothetical protein VM537_32020 [Anaerolineae bacterium]|nr:hypothetical protein [Anaerolineae bacterium]